MFYYFYRTSFSIRHYIDKYESILRDYNIKNYCTLNDDNDIDEIYESIDEMILKYNKKHKNNQIRMDSRFPKKQIVSTFKPYLKYYYKSLYSLSNNTRHENTLFMNSLLYNFTEKNPCFGKRKRVEHIMGYSYNYDSTVSDFESPINYKKNLLNCHLKNSNNYSNVVNNYIKNEDWISTIDNENHTFESLSNMLRSTVLNNTLLTTSSTPSSYPNVHIHFNENGNVNNNVATTENTVVSENMVGLYEENVSETSSIDTEILDYPSNTSFIMNSYMEERGEEGEEGGEEGGEERENDSVS